MVADDLDEAALKEVADGARDLPGSVHAVVCDVTGPDAPRTLLDAALRRYGQLHGLVSNAGRALFSPRGAVHFEATCVPRELPGFGLLVVGLTGPEVSVEVAP